MLTESQLRDLLHVPHETETIDFKQAFGSWTQSKLELARDIICMANRSGGHLIFGVAELPDKSFEVRGLAQGDNPPDPTDLNRLLGKDFRPNPIVAVATYKVEGKRLAVISVPQFSSGPNVCSMDGHDEKGKHVLQRGVIYRRSDEMACEWASADAVTALIDAAVAKRGAIYQQMDRPSSLAVNRAEVIAWDSSQSDSPITLRALRTSPVEAEVKEVPVRDLLTLLETASVQTRGATVAIPRNIDVRTLDPGGVVRSRHFVAVHSEQSNGSRSSVTVDTSGHVEIRETLWEDAESGPEARHANALALLAFIYGGLAFAKRIYSATSIESFNFEVGLLVPTGRTLTSSPGFWGFMRSYVVTAPNDIWIERVCSSALLGNPVAFVEECRSIYDEMLWYFGFALQDSVFEAHLASVRDSYFGPNVPEGRNPPVSKE